MSDEIDVFREDTIEKGRRLLERLEGFKQDIEEMPCARPDPEFLEEMEALKTLIAFHN